MTTETSDIPTLTTTSDARTLLDQLAETHEWVSVFWDRGWGNSGQTGEISIIVDGDDQNPKAYLTLDVYSLLRVGGVIGEDTYDGFKARKVHDFKTPPVPEKTGPTSTEVAEQVMRNLISAHPDRPIRARFYRGVNTAARRNPFASPILEEIVGTPAANVDGRHVLLCPAHSDVAMSAQEPDFLGYDIIGGGVADCLDYPKGAGGKVDIEALRGTEFAERLLAAVDEKVAVIEARRRETGTVG